MHVQIDFAFEIGMITLTLGEPPATRTHHHEIKAYKSAVSWLP